MTITQAKRPCLFRLPRKGGWGGGFLPTPARLLARQLDGRVATPFHVKSLFLDVLADLREDVQVIVSDAGFLALKIEPAEGAGGFRGTWRVLDFRPAPGRPRACRKCGCTDDCACVGGCSWVEPDLCSQCAGY